MEFCELSEISQIIFKTDKTKFLIKLMITLGYLERNDRKYELTEKGFLIAVKRNKKIIWIKCEVLKILMKLNFLTEYFKGAK